MTHLTREQRYTISVMKQKSFTQKYIADAIGKNKSVISRELKRNSDQRNGDYRFDLAQRKCEKRHSEKNKKKKFSIEMQNYVEKKLEEDLSPEQIHGRAKFENISIVSPERIYQHIWSNKKAGGTLHTHLRHKGRRYRKRGNNKDKRGILKNRKDIDLRPKIVEEKTRFGDLEIDTVIGQNHKGALLTINDRVTSKVWIKKLDSKEAENLAIETINTLMPFKGIIHTITADNGKEFAMHEKIGNELDVDVFFAKPYHSWERGANENTNGLVRQYFPKKTSFENISNEDVTRVVEILNNRPRKKLGFLTPNEYFFNNFGDSKKVAFIT